MEALAIVIWAFIMYDTADIANDNKDRILKLELTQKECK